MLLKQGQLSTQYVCYLNQVNIIKSFLWKVREIFSIARYVLNIIWFCELTSLADWAFRFFHGMQILIILQQ